MGPHEYLHKFYTGKYESPASYDLYFTAGGGQTKLNTHIHTVQVCELKWHVVREFSYSIDYIPLVFKFCVSFGGIVKRKKNNMKYVSIIFVH